MRATCYHCGNKCDEKLFVHNEKSFCCLGCKTVYEILTDNGMSSYYDIAQNPGAKPEEDNNKYDFLDNQKIVEKLLDFDDNHTQIVTLYIPHIHCSSCIWILENLNKLQPNIAMSLVNFPKKTVRITYQSDKISLKEVVLLLSHIGYAPYISLDDYQKKKDYKNRDIYYKLGVASFAFGNVMLLSFPEYFEEGEFWIEQYKVFFRWLMFALSLPVVFYASNSYFISAYKGLRSRFLNIDVPIALGILALFLRSTYDIVTNSGSGFFDSLTGLLFFLLLGKFFQQKTYNFLSFERDYKSYFPIGITKINANGVEQSVQVYDIEKGDRLLIRNQELIPVDAILIKGNAHIDYSFVTGEADPVEKQSGDKLFAGGKQTQGAIEVEAIKSVSQSYLTQLWANDVFGKNKTEHFQTLTDRVSQYFTPIILSIALISTIVWYFINPSMALNVFTSVLIIACPCALAMSAPFTLGNILRIFGREKLYLKNSKIIEQMANVDTLIFDKTGTITTANQSSIEYNGTSLSQTEKIILKNALRNSNHPLSRHLYAYLEATQPIHLEYFEEITGKGIIAKTTTHTIRIGAASFVGKNTEKQLLKTSVHIAIDDVYKGNFTFNNSYRKGMKTLFKKLSKQYDIAILSGDNESEKQTLEKMLPEKSVIKFNQKPNDKLQYIKQLQEKNKCVMMIGDGLNDAGALKQSHVGIALSENVNVFSPACDGILDASKLQSLFTYLRLSKLSIKVITISFILSFLYNVIGLSFAISGNLSPVIAAILMPLSSISIVVFTTISTNLLSRRMHM